MGRSRDDTHICLRVLAFLCDVVSESSLSLRTGKRPKTRHQETRPAELFIAPTCDQIELSFSLQILH